MDELRSLSRFLLEFSDEVVASRQKGPLPRPYVKTLRTQPPATPKSSAPRPKMESCNTCHQTVRSIRIRWAHTITRTETSAEATKAVQYIDRSQSLGFPSHAA